jgi:hypothetical protein
MNIFDCTFHTLSVSVLISLSLLSLAIKNKRLKRIMLNLITLVVGVLLVDVFMHLLPNTIARFIYGTHYMSLSVE